MATKTFRYRSTTLNLRLIGKVCTRAYMASFLDHQEPNKIPQCGKLKQKNVQNQ